MENRKSTRPNAPLATVESCNPTPRSMNRTTGNANHLDDLCSPWLNPAAILVKVVQKESIVVVLRPFVSIGCLFGLVQAKSTLKSFCLMVFCSFIVVASLLRTIMFMGVIRRVDATFAVTTVILMHFLKCIISINYLRCLLGPNSARFYAMWENVVEGGHHSSEGKVQTHKWVVGTLSFAAAETLLASFAFAMGTSSIYLELPGIESLFVYDELKLLNGVVMGVCTVFESSLQALYTVLCVAVYYEFKHMILKMSKTTMTTSEDVQRELTIFRLYHYQLIKLTEMLDEIISYYAFFVLSINMVLICGILFVISHSSNSFGATLSLSGWVIKLMIEISVITLPPSAISYVSVKPLFLVHEASNNFRLTKDMTLSHAIDDRENPEDHDKETCSNVAVTEDVDAADFMSEKIYQQTFLFVQQLSKRIIGITCGGFFIITKEALLTIASALVTYMALIMQLDLSAQFNCQCDCVQ